MHAATANPKVRLATFLNPHGRGEIRVSLSIKTQSPSRLGLGYHQEFDGSAAPTRTAHADAPVLVPISREHEVTARQTIRKAVAFDDLKAATRRHTCPDVAQPASDAHAAAAVLFSLTPKAGSPRSGSLAPRPSVGLAATWKVFSAVNSSSHAAKLKVLRA